MGGCYRCKGWCLTWNDKDVQKKILACRPKGRLMGDMAKKCTQCKHYFEKDKAPVYCPCCGQHLHKIRVSPKAKIKRAALCGAAKA